MEAIQEQIFVLLSVVLTTIIGIVANAIRNWLNAKFNKEQLEQGHKYADIVVNAVEQIYHEADGDEKFNKAKLELVKALQEKKINISEEQIDMLIESVVAEINKQTK